MAKIKTVKVDLFFITADVFAIRHPGAAVPAWLVIYLAVILT